MHDPSSTNPEPTSNATLRLVFTGIFGDQTDIIKDVGIGDMETIFQALREALAGCGFSQQTIDDWFPGEE